ncbi:MAG: PAS domain S-box protein [Chlorobiaceae bacterium]|nr:PAS domain S-box protein [Chlorobiaceae bacterium]
MPTKNILSKSNPVDDPVFALLESLPEDAVLIDPEGTILHANSLFASRIGVSAAECIGATLHDLVKPGVQLQELPVIRAEMIGEVFRTGKRMVFEEGSEDRTSRVTINPVLSPTGEVIRSLVTILDISGEERIEKESQPEHPAKNAILDAIPGFALILDASGQVMQMNQYACEVIRCCGEADIDDFNLFDFVCLDEVGSLRDKFLKILESGVEDRSEVRIRIHGEPVSMWLLISAKRILVEGRFCLIAVGTDITEGKLLENELRESRITFNYAMEAARAGIWECDINTNELIWSDQIWGLYGLELNCAPLNHKLCIDIVHPDDKLMAFQIISETVSKRLPSSLEYRVSYPDGSIHWLTSRGMPLYDAEGRVTRYIGSIIDITERKEIELELQESKGRLNQALDASRAGVWEWDLITDKNIWSDELWPLYGLELRNENPSFEFWASTIHPEDRESVINAGIEATNSKTDLYVEYRVCYPDGSIHWLMSRGKPFCDINGRVVRFIGTIIDITERKLMEEDLRISRERMNFILDNSHVGLWDLNLQEYSAQCTLEHARLFGYDTIRTEWSLEIFLNHVIEDDRDWVKKSITDSIDKHENYAFECRINRVDGELRWISVAGAFQSDSNDDSRFISGIVQDITERKVAEEALEASERKFRSIAEQISDMVFITDQYGITNYVSPAVETIAGYTIEEVIGRPFIEFIYEEDIEKAFNSFQEGLKSRQSEDVLELRYIKKDGSIFYAEIHVQYYLHQGFIGYVGLIRDITARKSYEQELIESKQFLKNIYDEVNYSIFVVDVLPDGSYQFKGINPLHESLTGIKSEQINGMKPEQFLPPEVAESVVSHYDDCIRAGKSIQYEESLPFKGEDSLWETVLNPVRDENGSVFRIIGTSINITERRKIEESRAKLEDQLLQSQKMEMVGRLAGGIAHDFNNMLTVILGHSEMAIEQMDPSLTAYADFDAIRQAATHSADLTRQLLAFARKQIVVPEIIELNTTVAEMLPMLRRLIGDNITLEWTPGCRNSHIKIDPSQIDQILVNLCVNARDAINGNGRITIESSSYTVHNIATEAGRSEEVSRTYVTLSVRDDGHGIDQNDISHIFEPFFTTKESGKGTGLGLSIVYGIVKQNDGNIDCESQEGKGTKFTIHLPLYRMPASRDSDVQAEQSIQKGYQTIMLVEDEPSILKLCKIILERNGYNVIAFCKSTDAIREAEAYRGTIDLLVTDVMMPEMNGSELSGKLLATRPDLKVLFISGYTDDVISQNSIFEAGFNFIQKPFQPKALITTVYNILNSGLLKEPVMG